MIKLIVLIMSTCLFTPILCRNDFTLLNKDGTPQTPPPAHEQVALAYATYLQRITGCAVQTDSQAVGAAHTNHPVLTNGTEAHEQEQLVLDLQPTIDTTSIEEYSAVHIEDKVVIAAHAEMPRGLSTFDNLAQRVEEIVKKLTEIIR